MCSVHREMFSTSGGVQYIRGISWFIWGSKFMKAFDLYWKPRCTEHPPMCSWYPPHASWYPPMYSWYPPMYWTSTNVLKISPQCTHVIPLCTEHPRCTVHTIYRLIKEPPISHHDIVDLYDLNCEISWYKQKNISLYWLPFCLSIGAIYANYAIDIVKQATQSLPWCRCLLAPERCKCLGLPGYL